MTDARQYVFGYGSLVLEGAGSLEMLPGHRRVWGVATDNVRRIPGYKTYLSRSNGNRVDVYVAFVDIEPDPSSVVRGLVRPVSEEELAELDLRERNYERVDVTDLIETDFGGPVWTYRGSAEGRARLDCGRAEGRAVVSKDYVERVHEGLRALGDGELERFEAQSDLPVADLERVDL